MRWALVHAASLPPVSIDQSTIQLEQFQLASTFQCSILIVHNNLNIVIQYKNTVQYMDSSETNAAK